MKRKCSLCQKPAFSRGWCRMHYMRWWEHGDPNIVLKIMPLTGEVQKFLHQAMNYSGDECLIWPFSTNNKGYAQIYINRKKFLVSRIVCEHKFGPSPSDCHQAAHSCGNGHLGCITKAHLRWATPKENMRDCIRHGTRIRGEKSPTAKLTEVEVLDIRRRAIAGENQKEIAADYGVEQTLVSMIKLRKRWGWLGPPTMEHPA